MIDLRPDLRGLMRQLALTPAEDGGRTILFMSARAEEGVSSVAASFALMAAETARKPVWLVDLDLRRNHAFNAFAVGEFASKFGGVGPPYSAYLKTRPFFAIEPEDANANASVGVFTAHRVGETRLMVTQFDKTRIKPGHSIRIRTGPEYWAAARAATSWTVVDAPALERSSAGLAIASQMDRSVIVVKADETTPEEVETLRRELVAHGGKVAGVVLNHERADARFIDQLTS
ncbi:MAG: sugar kinase [Alphaproteobacteria bacterium]|nr:sugar kinase [Alphaproteobacteria bacterium]